MQVTNHKAQNDWAESEFKANRRNPYQFSRFINNRIQFNRFAGHGVGAIALSVMLMSSSVAGTAASSSYADRPQNANHTQVLPSVGAPAASQYFAPTGKMVKGAFLNTYKRFGLQAIGYPLSEERTEDGRTVQYFERVRMESHPETADRGYGVQMTRLGADLSKPVQPFGSVASFVSTRSKSYVKETGHSLSEPFLSYWKKNGGVDVFGYPISEPMTQDGMRVQWFERARFEYHPELAKSGQVVQLSLLGKSALLKTGVQPAAASAPATPDQTAPVQEKPAVSAAPQTNLAVMESYLLQKINDERAASGLGPVQLNNTLVDIARSRSSDMAERNYFSHTTPDGTQFFSMLSDHNVSYKYAGEILARDNYPEGQAAEIAMKSYLGSSAHKAIIMDGRYNQIGVGFAKSDEDAMYYYTVIFVEQ